MRERPSLEIETDASLMGWGAVCAEEKIGGRWTDQESRLHINSLELLAVFHAVWAFAKDKTDLVIQVHLDNTTAVAYINHLGGTKSPDLRSLAVNLWDWCLQRHLFLIAFHIPGVNNTRADLLSRSVVDRHDWQLNPEVFREIDTLWGPLSVDLFVSRISRQTEIFQLETRSSSGSSRCFQSELDQLHRVCQSTLEFSTSLYTTDPTSRGHNCPDNPPVANSDMVSSSLPVVNRQPEITPSMSRSPNQPSGLQDSFTKESQPAGCLVHLRRSFQSSGLSEEATSLLLSSWRHFTSKNYDSWRIWE